jgi:FkbM family methyltransferase
LLDPRARSLPRTIDSTCCEEMSMLRLARALGKAFRRPRPTPPNDLPVPTAEVVARVLGQRITTVVDVGARWGMQDAWYRIPPLARLVGFEPDQEECARLNRQARQHGEIDHRYVPKALGSHTGPATLHVTADPACSSLYEPDPQLPDRYPGLNVIRLRGRQPVVLTTLEEWARTEDVRDVAFIKLDTQGAELDILRGAGSLLDTCLGVEAEVLFSPLYLGQPLFADVDVFLRGRGFTLWRLGSLAHYAERPSGTLRGQEVAYFDGTPANYRTGDGRLTWANAVYFRDYAGGDLDGRQLLLLAVLLHAAGDADAACASLERAVPEMALTAEQQEAIHDLAAGLRAA